MTVNPTAIISDIQNVQSPQNLPRAIKAYFLEVADGDQEIVNRAFKTVRDAALERGYTEVAELDIEAEIDRIAPDTGL